MYTMRMKKDISHDFRESKFRRKISKSAGQTSPLVSTHLVVNKVDGKTVCRHQFEMDRNHHFFQRAEGGYYTEMNRNPMPENRQRMQPWLESRINSQSIEGLQWIDKEQKIFRVRWKHVGNREWSERDGAIFREWAIHTGRYREGVDSPDWPTWKTRFRCALTKLPGIVELKDLNRLDTQTDEPYRVYQFVSRKCTGGDSVYTPPFEGQMMYDSDSNSQHSYMDCFPPDSVPRAIPTTVMSETDMEITDSLPSDIKNVDPTDLIQLDSNDIKNISLESGSPSFEMRVVHEGADFIEQIAKKPLPGHNNNQLSPAELFKIDLNNKKLRVTIKQLQLTVRQEDCDNPVGCRIFYNKNVCFSQEDFEKIFGSVKLHNIPLPICDSQIQTQQKVTLNILSAADRGVIISMKNGNIYATRKCRCRIYVSHPTLENKCEVLKLDRDVETLVYDVDNYFKQALYRYLAEKGPKPVTSVTIGFGQNFTMVNESLDNLLVSATVVHVEANEHLSKFVYHSPQSQEIEKSESTSTDHILDVLHFSQHTEL